jgi:hypothetical protein
MIVSMLAFFIRVALLGSWSRKPASRFGLLAGTGSATPFDAYSPCPLDPQLERMTTMNKTTLSRTLRVALLAQCLALAACGGNDSSTATGDFVSPRISGEYAKEIGKLPDWNGAWLMTGGQTERARLMFDADNVYSPPNPSAALDFGVLPGTYNTRIPYKPEYEARHKELIQMSIDGMSPDPVGTCMQPHGFPRQMGGIPVGPEIIVLPEMVLMSWAPLGAQRRIYTDGRPHPDPDLFPANFMGHSIGHWDGDTLVVDTTHMLEGIYDMSGAPHSDQIHVVERIRLIDNDTLENVITITDPVMLTEPWIVTRKYRRAKNRFPDLALEYCSPGSQVDFSKGYQELILPSELEDKGGQ